jgi:hypothetical protein
VEGWKILQLKIFVLVGEWKDKWILFYIYKKLIILSTVKEWIKIIHPVEKIFVCFNSTVYLFDDLYIFK